MEREVMDGIYQAWQTGLLWVCLCALGAMAAWLFLAKVAAPAWDALRRWWSLPCIQRVIVGVCVVGLSYYGATKQGWHVGYDGGIKAGATANVVTNDTVSIYWQRDTSGGVYVPKTATVYIDAIEHGSSNVVNIAQTTVGTWGWSGTVENATNYDYNAWAYYIPPEPVHTNGVWTYKTHFDRNGEYALPLRARVEVNGVAIATPAEKRKDMPYDAEVEYLESTGTQWIDTGIVHDQTSHWECDAEFTSIGTGNRYIGQSYKTATGGGAPRFAFGASSSSYWYAGLGNRNASGLATADTDRHVFVLDAPQKTFQIDDNTYAVNWSSFSLPTYVGCGLGLFGRSLLDTDDEVNPYCRMRIYSSKHYQNGVLVRDFIPVRVGNVGTLYDRRGVGGMNPDGSPRNDGMYFNRGTDDFVLGPDVVPVEWLEGGQLDSGIAFIDTGYTPNSSTKIESTSAILSAWGYSGRFGNRSRLTFGVGNGSLYLAQGNHYYLGGYAAGTFYSFVNDIPNRTVSVEGVGSTSTTAVSDWYPQLYPVYLFASNVDPTTGTAVNGKKLDTNSLGRIRMKSCNIWENDIPVRKFRPVRVGTEGAMMDTLTRRIYRNVGTGNFGYGNDK